MRVDIKDLERAIKEFYSSSESPYFVDSERRFMISPWSHQEEINTDLWEDKYEGLSGWETIVRDNLDDRQECLDGIVYGATEGFVMYYDDAKGRQKLYITNY